MATWPVNPPRHRKSKVGAYVFQLNALVAAVLFIGAVTPSSGATVPAAAPLNMLKVQNHYSEGDFDPAIAILEDFQKSHSVFTREESLMVYKYLGVMYSADPLTREKGKTYFYKLLKVDPTAKILDMYVSIMVQEIFKNTLEELMGGMPVENKTSQATVPRRRDRLESEKKSDSKPGSEKTAGTPAVSAGKSNKVYWWAGIGALAAVGGGYYWYSQTADQAEDSEINATF